MTKSRIHCTSSDDEDYDNTDDDNESDKSSDEDLPGVEEDTTSSRKRKCEFSILDETSSSKKKDTSVARRLPNVDNVAMSLSLRCLFVIYNHFTFCVILWKGSRL